MLWERGIVIFNSLAAFDAAVDTIIFRCNCKKTSGKDASRETYSLIRDKNYYRNSEYAAKFKRFCIAHNRLWFIKRCIYLELKLFFHRFKMLVFVEHDATLSV